MPTASPTTGLGDLDIFLRGLLIADTNAANPASLLSLMQANGAAGISVLHPTQRTGAAYPRLLMERRGGSQELFGDGLAKIFAGTVEVQIVARQAAACLDPLDCTERMYGRMSDLFLGNPTLSPVLRPAQGQQISAAYHLDVFYEDMQRFLPVSDPEFSRLSVRYRYKVTRSGF